MDMMNVDVPPPNVVCASFGLKPKGTFIISLDLLEVFYEEVIDEIMDAYEHPDASGEESIVDVILENLISYAIDVEDIARSIYISMYRRSYLETDYSYIEHLLDNPVVSELWLEIGDKLRDKQKERLEFVDGVRGETSTCIYSKVINRNTIMVVQYVR